MSDRRGFYRSVVFANVLVLVGGLAGLVGHSVVPDAAGPSTLVGPPVDARYEWRDLPYAPINGDLPRIGNSGVWTGTEFIVWGGAGHVIGHCPLRQHDGAAFDPGTGTWERLPEGPLASRVGHVTAWTGEEMIVWGGSGAPPHDNCRSDLLDDGARYDPRARRWRALPASPLGARTGAVGIWTGEALLVWGGQAATSQVEPFYIPLLDGAAFDPGAHSWRPIAPIPSRVAVRPVAIWADGEVLVWSDRRGSAYDPARDAWRRLARSPVTIFWDTPITWSQDLLWVFAEHDDTDLFSYDPSADKWTAWPRSPIPGTSEDRFSPGYTAVWADGELVVWGGDRPHVSEPCTHEGDRAFGSCGSRPYGPEGAIFDPDARAWRVIAPSPIGRRRAVSAVWTGTDVILFGGFDPEFRNAGQNYVPSPRIAGTGTRLALRSSG